MTLRVAVVGASGNVGTSVVDALVADNSVDEVLAIARRLPPPTTQTGVTWRSADIRTESLASMFTDIDVVIHLAWLFQPTHDPARTWETNVRGSLRVFEAAAAAGVGALVHASSVGAYSPGPQDRAVDERWPTHGWPGAAYTREKAYLERCLDQFEASHPHTRVVRLRPGFLFKTEAASEQRRLFAGPFIPNQVVRPRSSPVLPWVSGLRCQVAHTTDVANAYRLAATRPVRGAFNIAADPVIDADVLGELFDTRVVEVPSKWVRGALATLWRAHAVPASPHLFDAVLRLPIMDTTRAHEELGWWPAIDSRRAIEEFVVGLREARGRNTPPLTPAIHGGRWAEIRTGVGSRP